MTTYNTINEAFKNGEGDKFFTLGGQYIALSRHENNVEKMQALGFSFMKYEDVLRIGTAERKAEPVPVKKVEPVVFDTKKKEFFSWGSDRSYYDDYPDAYGQNL